MSYRITAATVVFDVLQKHGRSDLKKLRRELRKAYPFDDRTGWAYRIWLSETKKQLGFGLRAQKTDPNQLSLFD